MITAMMSTTFMVILVIITLPADIPVDDRP
jgi:hypothetical protein